MIFFNDLYNRKIRLTDERMAHILRHSEMYGQEELIAETLLKPDFIFLSSHDPSVHLYHRLFDNTPVTRKIPCCCSKKQRK